MTPQPLTRREMRDRERAAAAAGQSQEPPPITGAQRALGATLGRPRPKGRAAWILAIAAAAVILLIPLGVFWAVGRPEDPAVTVPDVAVAADVPLNKSLEVAGRLGSVPVVTLEGHLAPPSAVLTDTLITGTGRAIEAGDGIILSVSTFSGADGANTTGTDSGRRLYRGTLDTTTLGEDLAKAVTGAHEGSRLVMRAAVDRGGKAETEITVVDILPSIAEGKTVAAASGTPTVTMADDGTMSLSLGGAAAPTDGSTTVLIQGKGEQIKPTDKVIARYMVVSWADGAVKSSSYGWKTAPAIIDMTDTLSGLAQRLTDVQVGSRVLVSLPADQARGDNAIAVVVDVLGIANDAAAPTATASPTDAVVRVTPSAHATTSGH